MKMVTHFDKLNMFKRLDRAFNAGNPFFYGIMQIITFFAFIGALFQGYGWEWWLAAFIVQQLSVGLGISVGYHRYFCHNSFTVNFSWVKKMFVWLSIWTMGGSPTGFSVVHLLHHQFSDKPGDPHSPKLAGWRVFSAAHSYMTREAAAASTAGVKKRILRHTDIDLLFYHKWFWLLCLIPPTLMAIVSIAANSWTPFIMLWMVPAAVRFWCGPASAWYSHRGRKGGRVLFDTKDDSCDTVLAGVFLWEGPHNHHHARPGKWDYRVRWYDWDPGAWFLMGMEKLGLVKLRNIRDAE